MSQSLQVIRQKSFYSSAGQLWGIEVGNEQPDVISVLLRTEVTNPSCDSLGTSVIL